MCCCNGETVDHLLLHCPVAGVLWSWIFQAFGVHWVLFGKVADLLFSLWNGLGLHSSDIWKIVPLCLMWTIWMERNQRTFEDVSRLNRQILEGFILTLFDWSRAWGYNTSTSTSEFISSLFFISHDVNPWCVSVHILCTLLFFNISSSITYQKNSELYIINIYDDFWDLFIYFHQVCTLVISLMVVITLCVLTFSLHVIRSLNLGSFSPHLCHMTSISM